MRRPTFTSTSPDPLVERRPVRRFAHGTVGWNSRAMLDRRWPYR
jgi:hypothetical protein